MRHKIDASNWGAWLLARSELVGFRSQAELAAAVGCVRQQLHRWFNMSAPPSSMHKGFDVALARAMKTDRRTLFVDYAKMLPSVAPLVEDAPELPGDDLRNEIRTALPGMGVDSLRVIHATTRALVETAVHAA